MELTSQVLREVEFSGSLRGYNTDEVDEFLEKVAVAADALRQELVTVSERVDRAERVTKEQSGLDDEESIRRTLILAQRTADLAIKEAQEEAGQILDRSRSEAETIVSDARTQAERLVSDSERRLREEVGRLTTQREALHGELDTLVSLLTAERERLTESLGTTLRFVERNLSPSSELMTLAAADSAAPTESTVSRDAADAQAAEAEELDELEAAIAADAAAAAPSMPMSRGTDLDDDWESPRMVRPSLMALPTLDDQHLDEATASWDVASQGQAGSPAS